MSEKWTWANSTMKARADWVRKHIEKLGEQQTAVLFGLSDWAILNIKQGGEWIAAYDKGASHE